MRKYKVNSNGSYSHGNLILNFQFNEETYEYGVVYFL